MAQDSVPRHLPSLPEAGHPGWKGRRPQRRSRWHPKLNAFSAGSPPIRATHMTPSDQIWNSLHKVIGSQEVLTGLDRRLPRDTSWKWLLSCMGSPACDQAASSAPFLLCPCPLTCPPSPIAGVRRSWSTGRVWPVLCWTLHFLLLSPEGIYKVGFSNPISRKENQRLRV